MKKSGHPRYQQVLFVDTATGKKFVCGAAMPNLKEKEVFEGVEYPVYRASVTSDSHPFFTGSTQFVDSEGRVDKFNKRFKKPLEAAKKAEAQEESAKKVVKKATKKGG